MRFPGRLLFSFCFFLTNSSASSSASENKSIQQQARQLKKEQYQIASELLRTYPDDFNAIRVMGYAHSSHGNFEKMLLCWERCRNLQPKRADIHDRLARYYERREDYDLAIESWNLAIKLDPKLLLIHYRKGSALLDWGKPELALPALQTQLKLTPDHAQTRYLLGEIYFQTEQFEKAKTAFAETMKIQPDHLKACYGLVKTCARLSQIEEMQTHAKEFRSLEQQAIKADAEIRKSHDDIQDMERKLAITCVDAGRVYLAHRKPADAERLWHRAAELDANNVAARKELAVLFEKRGSIKKAIAMYAALTKLQPGEVENYKRAGLLHIRANNYDHAETLLKKIIELQPQEGRRLSHTGEILLERETQI